MVTSNLRALREGAGEKKKKKKRKKQGKNMECGAGDHDGRRAESDAKGVRIKPGQLKKCEQIKRGSTQEERNNSNNRLWSVWPGAR